MIGGITLLVVWSMIWTGIALWYAGKHQQKGWFVALFVLNTIGILPIIYLLVFRPRNSKENRERSQRVTSAGAKQKPKKKK